jgi:hypothetical protein
MCADDESLLVDKIWSKKKDYFAAICRNQKRNKRYYKNYLSKGGVVSGATPISIMTISLTTLSIIIHSSTTLMMPRIKKLIALCTIKLSIMSLSKEKLDIMALNIMTLHLSNQKNTWHNMCDICWVPLFNCYCCCRCLSLSLSLSLSLFLFLLLFDLFWVSLWRVPFCHVSWCWVSLH